MTVCPRNLIWKYQQKTAILKTVGCGGLRRRNGAAGAVWRLFFVNNTIDYIGMFGPV